MGDIPFTRPTVIAASEFLGFALKTHTQVNKIVVWQLIVRMRPFRQMMALNMRFFGSRFGA
ncbi:hypothetical protein RRH01S_16_00230 [Rhizobium rhizogenes NBRC 13257]|uniref:Uncharacterized protein n=1 Tax=Rhizobium rhizogenes NBRC 13257 TaxID=1220581 RepID=A0AA87UC93_RHIRH|nr:hypothetical protein RRH01S_16_00230 [Rhizobium rhizogenes NBRC 13257]